MGCTATADTTVGSTCAITTTADTLVPGAITAGKRAIWQLGDLQVYDGGAAWSCGRLRRDAIRGSGIFVP